MFGIGLPDALPLFMREFDDGAALAVFGIKVLCEIWPGIVRASALMRSTAAAYSSRRSGFSRERNTVISIDVGSFRKTKSRVHMFRIADQVCASPGSLNFDSRSSRQT